MAYCTSVLFQFHLLQGYQAFYIDGRVLISFPLLGGFFFFNILMEIRLLIMV